ncbi:MAG: ABC transporter substrate-binding protein [Acidimicrobiia bacterium]
MPNQLLRALGASIVLIGVAVAGIIQIADRDAATAIEIASDPDDGSSSSTPPGPEVVAGLDDPEAFIYRVGLLGTPENLNFWEFYGSPPTVWESYLLSPTKASLYRLETDTLTLAPDLAAGMVAPTWNSDGWRVVVPLRTDSRFSDGRELTAHDLEFTFTTVRNFSLGGQWEDAFPDVVSSVTAIDLHTVEVRFNRRPSLEVWPFGVGTAPVMSADHWSGLLTAETDAGGLFAVDPAGDPASGPLELVEASADGAMSQPNPGYAGLQGRSIEYVVFGSSADAVDALAGGDIHTILSPRGLTVTEGETLAASAGVETITSPAFGVRYLAFNTHRFPMSDLAFRRAVAMLVDRQALAGSVAGAEAARTMLPAANSTWFDESRAPETAETSEDRGPALAIVLDELKASGYSWQTEPSFVDGSFVAGTGLAVDGQKPATLTILTSGDAFDAERTSYAAKVGAAVEILGFEVLPVTTDFDTVIDLAFTPDESGALGYDMALLGWSLGNPGLPSFYGDLFGSESPANNTGYANPEMDELIRRYQNASDLAIARALLWEMEELQARDLPYLPLYFSHMVEGYRSDAIAFSAPPGLGGIQGALGAFHLVDPVD